LVVIHVARNSNEAIVAPVVKAAFGWSQAADFLLLHLAGIWLQSL
jgi:hypothetical protein